MLNSDKNEIELNKIKTSENIHQMVVTEDTEIIPEEVKNLILDSKLQVNSRMQEEQKASIGSLPDSKFETNSFIQNISYKLLKIGNYFSTNSNINNCIIFITIISMIWLFVYSINSQFALPGGVFYPIWVLWTLGLVSGYLTSKLKLPGMISMIVVGMITSNLSYIKLEPIEINSTIGNVMRKMALCVILCRAGLGVNIKILKTIKLQVIKLSCLPVAMEAISFSIVNGFILNMPFEWSFLLGFIVAGVSPAIVILYMLDFQEKKIGTNKGIPTLFIASACFDNIIAITGNSAMIGIVFNQGDLWWTLVKTPLQIIISIVLGIILGLLLSIVKLSHLLHVSVLRFILLFMFALILLFGSSKLNLPSIGPLGILCLSITAKLAWLKVDSVGLSLEETKGVNQVSGLFNKMWKVLFEPLLFASIGNQIVFSKLEGKSIGLGIASLMIGFSIRFTTTFLSSMCSHFNWKEKLFIAIAWFPKATVQAAIGALALDIAKTNKNEVQIKLATEVLTIAVFSILLTAPIGAFLITFLGPKMLTKEKEDGCNLAQEKLI